MDVGAACKELLRKLSVSDLTLYQLRSESKKCHDINGCLYAGETTPQAQPSKQSILSGPKGNGAKER